MSFPEALADPQARELLHRAQRLEGEALDWVYRRYSQRIYRYAYARLGDPGLAREVTAEVFAHLLRGLPAYRIPPEHVLASFSAWLYRVAHNVLVSWLRRASRRREAPEELAEASGLALSHALEQVLLRQDVREVLARLTEAQRAVILLRYYEGLSLAEVAALLGTTLDGVKSLQKRAFQTLREELAHYRVTEPAGVRG